MLRISLELTKKYSEENLGNFWKLNSDPLKIFQIVDQFQRISQEFPRNQSQEFVLAKFPRNFSKQVTKTGELKRNSSLFYLGMSQKKFKWAKICSFELFFCLCELFFCSFELLFCSFALFFAHLNFSLLNIRIIFLIIWTIFLLIWTIFGWTIFDTVVPK